MSKSANFKANDFVWAKMPTYPPWPAIVMTPHKKAPPKLKSASQWIYFFGTYNYAWIDEKNIHHFEAMKEKNKTLCKTSQFIKAVNEAENHIKGLAKEPNYQIKFVEYIVKERRPSPKKPQKSNTTSNVPTITKRPSKEMIKGSPRKKPRSSLSADLDARSDVTSAVGLSISRSQSVASSTFETETEILNADISEASEKKFGVLGTGSVGNGVIKNLITSGHTLNIWNSVSKALEEFESYTEREGSGSIKICNTPSEVVRESDIVFSCLTDIEEVKQMFQEFFLSSKSDQLMHGKGFVEMTGIDPETSKVLCELVESKGGQYLEALLQGNKTEAIEGNLVVLLSGNRKLYMECQTCFKAMGKVSFYLGQVGGATKVYLILQVMRGVFLAGMSEAFAMADKCDISPNLFLGVFKSTSLCSTYLEQRAKVIADKTFQEAQEPLCSLQRDMANGMDLSNRFKQPMPLVAAANEMFKYTRRLGYDNHDSSCVYQRARH